MTDDLQATLSNWLHELSKLLSPRFQISLVFMPFPKGPTEAGFLRLVAWSYGCFFEAGKGSVTFLTSRPFGANAASDVDYSRNALAIIDDLRTYSFHNLPPSTRRNNARTQRVRAWFVQSCGTADPETDTDWKLCFDALRTIGIRLSGILSASITMLAEDGNSEIVDDLITRLSTGLPAYKYDEFIREAARTQLVQIDVRAFRDRHLNEWQTQARLLGPDSVDETMRKIVRRTLLDFVATIA